MSRTDNNKQFEGSSCKPDTFRGLKLSGFKTLKSQYALKRIEQSFMIMTTLFYKPLRILKVILTVIQYGQMIGFMYRPGTSFFDSGDVVRGLNYVFGIGYLLQLPFHDTAVFPKISILAQGLITVLYIVISLLPLILFLIPVVNHMDLSQAKMTTILFITDVVSKTLYIPAFTNMMDWFNPKKATSLLTWPVLDFDDDVFMFSTGASIIRTVAIPAMAYLIVLRTLHVVFRSSSRYSIHYISESERSAHFVITMVVTAVCVLTTLYRTNYFVLGVADIVMFLVILLYLMIYIPMMTFPKTFLYVVAYSVLLGLALTQTVQQYIIDNGASQETALIANILAIIATVIVASVGFVIIYIKSFNLAMFLIPLSIRFKKSLNELFRMKCQMGSFNQFFTSNKWLNFIEYRKEIENGLFKNASIQHRLFKKKRSFLKRRWLEQVRRSELFLETTKITSDFALRAVNKFAYTNGGCIGGRKFSMNNPLAGSMGGSPCSNVNTYSESLLIIEKAFKDRSFFDTIFHELASCRTEKNRFRFINYRRLYEIIFSLVQVLDAIPHHITHSQISIASSTLLINKNEENTKKLQLLFKIPTSFFEGIKGTDDGENNENNGDNEDNQLKSQSTETREKVESLFYDAIFALYYFGLIGNVERVPTEFANFLQLGTKPQKYQEMSKDDLFELKDRILFALHIVDVNGNSANSGRLSASFRSFFELFLKPVHKLYKAKTIFNIKNKLKIIDTLIEQHLYTEIIRSQNERIKRNKSNMDGKDNSNNKEQNGGNYNNMLIDTNMESYLMAEGMIDNTNFFSFDYRLSFVRVNHCLTSMRLSELSDFLLCFKDRISNYNFDRIIDANRIYKRYERQRHRLMKYDALFKEYHGIVSEDNSWGNNDRHCVIIEPNNPLTPNVVESAFQITLTKRFRQLLVNYRRQLLYTAKLYFSLFASFNRSPVLLKMIEEFRYEFNLEPLAGSLIRIHISQFLNNKGGDDCSCGNTEGQTIKDTMRNDLIEEVDHYIDSKFSAPNTNIENKVSYLMSMLTNRNVLMGILNTKFKGTSLYGTKVPTDVDELYKFLGITFPNNNCYSMKTLATLPLRLNAHSFLRTSLPSWLTKRMILELESASALSIFGPCNIIKLMRTFPSQHTCQETIAYQLLDSANVSGKRSFHDLTGEIPHYHRLTLDETVDLWRFKLSTTRNGPEELHLNELKTKARDKKEEMQYNILRQSLCPICSEVPSPNFFNANISPAGIPIIKKETVVETDRSSSVLPSNYLLKISLDPLPDHPDDTLMTVGSAPKQHKPEQVSEKSIEISFNTAVGSTTAGHTQQGTTTTTGRLDPSWSEFRNQDKRARRTSVSSTASHFMTDNPVTPRTQSSYTDQGNSYSSGRSMFRIRRLLNDMKHVDQQENSNEAEHHKNAKKENSIGLIDFFLGAVHELYLPLDISLHSNMGELLGLTNTNPKYWGSSRHRASNGVDVSKTLQFPGKFLRSKHYISYGDRNNFLRVWRIFTTYSNNKSEHCGFVYDEMPLVVDLTYNVKCFAISFGIEKRLIEKELFGILSKTDIEDTVANPANLFNVTNIQTAVLPTDAKIAILSIRPYLLSLIDNSSEKAAKKSREKIASLLENITLEVMRAQAETSMAYGRGKFIRYLKRHQLTSAYPYVLSSVQLNCQVDYRQNRESADVTQALVSTSYSASQTAHSNITTGGAPGGSTSQSVNSGIRISRRGIAHPAHDNFPIDTNGFQARMRYAKSTNNGNSMLDSVSKFGRTGNISSTIGCTNNNQTGVNIGRKQGLGGTRAPTDAALQKVMTKKFTSKVARLNNTEYVVERPPIAGNVRSVMAGIPDKFTKDVAKEIHSFYNKSCLIWICFILLFISVCVISLYADGILGTTLINIYALFPLVTDFQMPIIKGKVHQLFAKSSTNVSFLQEVPHSEYKNAVEESKSSFLFDFFSTDDVWNSPFSDIQYNTQSKSDVGWDLHLIKNETFILAPTADYASIEVDLHRTMGSTMRVINFINIVLLNQINVQLPTIPKNKMFFDFFGSESEYAGSQLVSKSLPELHSMFDEMANSKIPLMKQSQIEDVETQLRKRFGWMNGKQVQSAFHHMEEFPNETVGVRQPTYNIYLSRIMTSEAVTVNPEYTLSEGMKTIYKYNAPLSAIAKLLRLDDIFSGVSKVMKGSTPLLRMLYGTNTVSKFAIDQKVDEFQQKTTAIDSQKNPSYSSGNCLMTSRNYENIKGDVWVDPKIIAAENLSRIGTSAQVYALHYNQSAYFLKALYMNKLDYAFRHMFLFDGNVILNDNEVQKETNEVSTYILNSNSGENNPMANTLATYYSSYYDPTVYNTGAVASPSVSSQERMAKDIYDRELRFVLGIQNDVVSNGLKVGGVKVGNEKKLPLYHILWLRSMASFLIILFIILLVIILIITVRKILGISRVHATLRTLVIKYSDRERLINHLLRPQSSTPLGQDSRARTVRVARVFWLISTITRNMASRLINRVKLRRQAETEIGHQAPSNQTQDDTKEKEPELSPMERLIEGSILDQNKFVRMFWLHVRPQSQDPDTTQYEKNAKCPVCILKKYERRKRIKEDAFRLLLALVPLVVFIVISINVDDSEQIQQQLLADSPIFGDNNLFNAANYMTQMIETQTILISDTFKFLAYEDIKDLKHAIDYLNTMSEYEKKLETHADFIYVNQFIENTSLVLSNIKYAIGTKIVHMCPDTVSSYVSEDVISYYSLNAHEAQVWVDVFENLNPLYKPTNSPKVCTNVGIFSSLRVVDLAVTGLKELNFCVKKAVAIYDSLTEPQKDSMKDYIANGNYWIYAGIKFLHRAQSASGASKTFVSKLLKHQNQFVSAQASTLRSNFVFQVLMTILVASFLFGRLWESVRNTTSKLGAKLFSISVSGMIKTLIMVAEFVICFELFVYITTQKQLGFVSLDYFRSNFGFEVGTKMLDSRLSICDIAQKGFDIFIERYYGYYHSIFYYSNDDHTDHNTGNTSERMLDMINFNNSLSASDVPVTIYANNLCPAMQLTSTYIESVDSNYQNNLIRPQTGGLIIKDIYYNVLNALANFIGISLEDIGFSCFGEQFTFEEGAKAILETSKEHKLMTDETYGQFSLLLDNIYAYLDASSLYAQMMLNAIDLQSYKDVEDISVLASRHTELVLAAKELFPKAKLLSSLIDTSRVDIRQNAANSPFVSGGWDTKNFSVDSSVYPTVFTQLTWTEKDFGLDFNGRRRASISALLENPTSFVLGLVMQGTRRLRYNGYSTTIGETTSQYVHVLDGYLTLFDQKRSNIVFDKTNKLDSFFFFDLINPRSYVLVVKNSLCVICVLCVVDAIFLLISIIKSSNEDQRTVTSHSQARVQSQIIGGCLNTLRGMVARRNHKRKRDGLDIIKLRPYKARVPVPPEFILFIAEAVSPEGFKNGLYQIIDILEIDRDKPPGMKIAKNRDHERYRKMLEESTKISLDSLDHLGDGFAAVIINNKIVREKIEWQLQPDKSAKVGEGLQTMFVNSKIKQSQASPYVFTESNTLNNLSESLVSTSTTDNTSNSHFRSVHIEGGHEGEGDQELACAIDSETHDIIKFVSMYMLKDGCVNFRHLKIRNFVKEPIPTNEGEPELDEDKIGQVAHSPALNSVVKTLSNELMRHASCLSPALARQKGEENNTPNATDRSAIIKATYIPSYLSTCFVNDVCMLCQHQAASASIDIVGSTENEAIVKDEQCGRWLTLKSQDELKLIEAYRNYDLENEALKEVGNDRGSTGGKFTSYINEYMSAFARNIRALYHRSRSISVFGRSANVVVPIPLLCLLVIISVVLFIIPICRITSLLSTDLLWNNKSFYGVSGKTTSAISALHTMALYHDILDKTYVVYNTLMDISLGSDNQEAILRLEVELENLRKVVDKANHIVATGNTKSTKREEIGIALSDSNTQYRQSGKVMNLHVTAFYNSYIKDMNTLKTKYSINGSDVAMKIQNAIVHNTALTSDDPDFTYGDYSKLISSYFREIGFMFEPLNKYVSDRGQSFVNSYVGDDELRRTMLPNTESGYKVEVLSRTLKLLLKLKDEYVKVFHGDSEESNLSVQGELFKNVDNQWIYLTTIDSIRLLVAECELYQALVIKGTTSEGSYQHITRLLLDTKNLIDGIGDVISMTTDIIVSDELTVLKKHIVTTIVFTVVCAVVFALYWVLLSHIVTKVHESFAFFGTLSGILLAK